MMAILILIAVGVWVACSFKIVYENEIAVVSLFGEPKRVVKSGLRFVPFLISNLVRYPTLIQEFEFPSVSVLTQGSAKHSSVKVTGDLSVRFRFPANQNLIRRTIKTFPLTRSGMESLLKEAAYDIVEGVAHSYDWEDLYVNTRGFNDKITAVVKDLRVSDPDNVIVQAALDKVRIMFTNPNLPKELEEAIPKPESAALLAEAAKRDMVIRAEGESEAEKKKAEGKAEAKRKMAEAEAFRTKQEYAAIAGDNYAKEDGLAIRKMEALEKAAEGDSNMVLSLPELTDFASKATGLVQNLMVKPKP